jgi:stage III sporulation protein AA
VTIGGKNLPIAWRGDSETLGGLLTAFCRGSVYAYRDTLCQGFVPLPGGARLGVTGRAVTEGETLRSVGAVTALCLRLPHRVHGAADEALGAWEAAGRNVGMLICAPPAGGKTTLLRDLIASISCGTRAMRVAVVDTRGELCPDEEGELVDVLDGYPRAQGMEIALRVLSPQVIVCDEIGEGEVECIEGIAHSGVPLIASVHAESPEELERRAVGRRLLDTGAFRLLCTVRRTGNVWFSHTEAACCVG